MAHTLITNCPICQNTLTVSKLHCHSCNTVIENDFELSKFTLLSQEQLQFIETFLLCRGNIKEVEKELGISYPTVRGKLNDIIQALGHKDREKSQVDESRIVGMLERGEITPDEAIKMLKNKGGI
ncbi:DUF2089 domain-containing protein [Ornithinibacillus scapharcae]|uniref:DUF2089 domain-containing protein n=1 Tax=Ornithinibacillus scapharcae TaxID=1147159 RepID=UPI000225B88A|nr:DUF2089 domain-containing protein [Ornithinibacillus scapharcae]